MPCPRRPHVLSSSAFLTRCGSHRTNTLHSPAASAGILRFPQEPPPGRGFTRSTDNPREKPSPGGGLHDPEALSQQQPHFHLFPSLSCLYIYIYIYICIYTHTHTRLESAGLAVNFTSLIRKFLLVHDGGQRCLMFLRVLQRCWAGVFVFKALS